MSSFVYLEIQLDINTNACRYFQNIDIRTSDIE